jgi:hypothetical protein
VQICSIVDEAVGVNVDVEGRESKRTEEHETRRIYECANTACRKEQNRRNLNMTFPPTLASPKYLSIERAWAQGPSEIARAAVVDLSVMDSWTSRTVHLNTLLRTSDKWTVSIAVNCGYPIPT